MNYIINLKMDYKDKALNDLRNVYADFDSLPLDFRQILIKDRATLLQKEDVEKKILERQEDAKKYAEYLKQSEIPERISLPNIKRHKGVSISFEETSEDMVLEPRPFIFDGLNIRCFRRETIFSLKNKILNMVKESSSFKNVSRQSVSFMYFKIFNKGKVIASTKSVNIYEDKIDERLEDLCNNFDDVLKKIIDVTYGYESLFVSETYSYVIFYAKSIYFPQPRCVNNWGNNIPNILTFDSFKLFTANKNNVSCIKQCSRFLWQKDFNTLEEMIEYKNGNICIVTPQLHINDVRDIKSFNDIRLYSESPIKTFSVIDNTITYLFYFKEHLGVIFNITKSRHDRRVTKFSPLSKFSDVKNITVCFDIESYFDPEKESNQVNIPFICCASIIYNKVIGNIVDFEGRDCVAQMIEYVVDICGELNISSVELIAHNGGGYDFHYILSSMYNPAAIKNILIRNNSFISFNFAHDGVKFSVKDSYSFLLCSLANASKAFLNEETFKKTDFPHHDLKTADDLYKVYKEWSSVNTEINHVVEKEKLLITSEHIVNFTKNDKSKTLIEWSKDYCRNDVLVLSKVWLEFKNAVEDIFNCELVDQTMTLAGLSYKLFQANMPFDVELRHPNKEDYFNMREALIGGRCISVNGIYKDVLCLDVKSLYPASMAFYDQPYGSFKRVSSRPKDELGIYYVRVTPNRNNKSNFFPIRSHNKITYNNFEESTYIAWYTNVDIDIGLSEGHNIEYIPFDSYENIGYSWSKKGKIFEKYIKDVLYKLKIKYEKQNNKVKRNVIKIIMNSLWGKFAQKWVNFEYFIKSEDDIDFESEEAYKIWDTDFMLIKKIKESTYSSKPIQNGVFTLSWARYHMKSIWDAGAKEGAECIYSDTDSIFVHKEHFKKNAKFMLNGLKVPIIGSEVGQLELECEFDKLLCAGKKQYMGFYTYFQDGKPCIKEKKRFKGIPSNYIIPELYAHLLSGADKEAKIQFLKFRREWGSVKGYIENKTVKAT